MSAMVWGPQPVVLAPQSYVAPASYVGEASYVQQTPPTMMMAPVGTQQYGAPVATQQYGAPVATQLSPRSMAMGNPQVMRAPASPRSMVMGTQQPMAVCTKCGQMITGEVLTTGEGFKFHPGCFTCDNCGGPLPGKFNQRDGLRLCNGCVPKEAHNNCNMCGVPITGKEVSTGNGLYFHPECLTCDACGTAVAGSFNLRNGRKLCDKCNTAKTCTKCGLAIFGGAVTTKDGSRFHPQCLLCDQCGVLLSGPFHLHEGKRVCDMCVPKPEAKMCQRCGQVIAGRYVTVGSGQFMHPECFTCACCFKPLSGIRLFRKDSSRRKTGEIKKGKKTKKGICCS